MVVSAPIVAWCDVAVTDVPDVEQLVDAPALDSCPLNAMAVPAPANANAVTEANMVVRNDDIGISLMGSGISEPFAHYIARRTRTVTRSFRFSGFSKEVTLWRVLSHSRDECKVDDTDGLATREPFREIECQSLRFL